MTGALIDSSPEARPQAVRAGGVDAAPATGSVIARAPESGSVEDAVERPATPDAAAGLPTTAERRPSMSDVARAYRLFLGRNPESAAAIGHQIATSASLWNMIERFHGSEEARRLRLSEAAAGIAESTGQCGSLSIACTPDEFDRMLASTVEAWDEHGLGARWRWLVRHQQRFDDRSRNWTIARSFESGRQETAQFRALLEAAGHALPETPAVIVLGEESARMADAITTAAYLGVEPRSADLSPRREALAERGLTHASLDSIAGFRARVFAADLFYTVMTLQHAPPPVAYALLEHGLNQVRPGGLAVVQLACHVHDYRFDPAAYLAGEGREPRGELHALPQHLVLGLFEKLGFAPILITPDERLKELGISFTFVAHRA